MKMSLALGGIAAAAATLYNLRMLQEALSDKLAMTVRTILTM